MLLNTHNNSKRMLVPCMVAASLFLILGCRTDRAIQSVANNLIAQPDPTVELLETELRWMEDNIYRIDHQLDATLRQLDSTRRNNAALRLQLAQVQRVQHVPGSRQVPNGQILAPPPVQSDLRPSVVTPQIVQPSGEFDEEKSTNDDSIYDLSAPKIDMGAPTPGNGDANINDEGIDPQYELPEGASTTDPDVPKLESIMPRKPTTPDTVKPQIELPEDPFKDDIATPPVFNNQGGASGEVSAPPAEINTVTRIQLNRRLTGGYSFDGQAGHDGIMVVFEPQDAYARYVAAAGPVTIEVRDPAKSGVSGQVGKWSFSEVEVQPRLKQTLMGKGIHLELPWPAGSPTAKLLELTVEYQSPQGKRLTAKQTLRNNPTTSALVNQADAAEQGFIVQPPITASRWQPTR